ncbi:hypothetical protein AX16_002049 [Volvariella volvacea WC 439]|nr:hypothetical protein AX16_002049 [Volvariella volvacea WC 439]
MTLPILLAVVVALVGATYYRLVRAISYSGGVPRVGRPGVIGYIIAATQYTLDAESIINEGREAFGGRPFAVPTLNGPIFVLGPEYTERVRSSPDAVLSAHMAVDEDLQLPYTMNAAQLQNPYQATVVRTDLTRALPSLISELLEETKLAFDELFKFSDEKKSMSIPVFDRVTYLIARISNRALLGTGLGRNDHFLHAIVRFSETTPMMAPFIAWAPSLLRPIIYFVLSSAFGGKKAPLKFIVPFLDRYLKERESLEEKPSILAEYLIKNAPPGETTEGIAMRIMNMNFGSIHTSSIFITQTLFELAMLPESTLDEIRSEVVMALEAEGGWTKTALLKFRKIDSALREVGRVYGLMHFALGRYAINGYQLDDGCWVPPGYRVAVDMHAVHFDPEVYPNPRQCDLFRFSKLRDLEDTDTKYGFATVDSHYLPFGAGRHACAGRFFAATELKVMLAHILLNYDFRFVPKRPVRPKNLVFNGAILPDPKVHLVFTPRKTEGR